MSESFARDINIFGSLEGYANLGGSSNGVNAIFGYDQHAFIYNVPTGTMTDITPKPHRAEARSINDQGEIVGCWSSIEGYHPFRRLADCVFSEFVASNTSSHTISPSLINNSGHAA